MDESSSDSSADEDVLQKKSSERYLQVYNTYKKWQEEHKNSLSNSDENNLLVYFNSLKGKLKPPTLWSIWSMLRKTLSANDNIDISNFVSLKNLIKNNAIGYKPKKSFALKWDQIMKFMTEASDHNYLSTKVILIFGICGALRCDEITSIKVKDVEDLKDKFLVSVHYNKNEFPGQFIIGNLFYDKVKKYILLRPTDNFSDRFFIQYQNGRCTRQPIGRNKIGEMPESIASYLNLENAKRYTGHCFRRTAATLLSESGANMQIIRQLGRWRSDIIAQGYIGNSIHNRQLIYSGIAHETRKIKSKPSASTKITTKQKEAEFNHDLECSDFSEEYTINKLAPIRVGPSEELLHDNAQVIEIKKGDGTIKKYYNKRKTDQQLLNAYSQKELQDNTQKIEIKSTYQINNDFKNNRKAEQELLDADSQESSNVQLERNASGNMNYNFEHHQNASGKQSNSRTSVSNATNGTMQLNTSIWAQIKQVQSEIGETTLKLTKLHKKLEMLIKLQDNNSRVSNETPLNERAKKTVENGAASHSPTDEIMEVAIKNEIDSEESDDLNTVETVWFPELNVKNEDDDSRGSLDLINTEETDWLTEISPLKSPYYPQIDDLVMYFPQGYETYLQAVKKYQMYDVDELAVPYMDSNLTAHQLVKVVAISYENYPPRVSRLQLQPINENCEPKDETFEVSFHNVNGVVDFLIQKHLYDTSITNSWNEGDRFRCTIDDDLAFGYVESIEPYNEKFPDSLFKRYRVRFDDDTEFKLSPWELEPIDNPDNQNATLYKCQPEDWSVDGIEVNKEKIMECLQEVVKLPIAKPFLHLNKDASYASYVRYPIDLSMILARYENNFYRRVNAMKFDIDHLAANIEEIIKNPNSVNIHSKRRKDNFKHYKIIQEVLLTILEDPENTDVYDLHEHLKESQEENNDDTSVNYEPPIRLQESLHSLSDDETSKTCKSDWINSCKVLFDKILKDEDSQPFRKNTYLMNLDRVNENLNKEVYISPSAFCRDMRAVFSRSKMLVKQTKMQKDRLDRLRTFFNGEMKEIIFSWKANRKFKDLSEKILNKRKSNSSNHPNEENLDTPPEKRPRRINEEAGPSKIPNKLLDTFDKTISDNNHNR